MNIAERVQFEKLKDEMTTVGQVPAKLKSYTKSTDEKLDDFERRLAFIEKQHQAVLENLKNKK